jgi:multiple sugar transport system substrate-binding protein
MLSVLDMQIAAFEVANPEIRVEVVRAPRDPAQRRKWVTTHLDEGDTSIDIYVLDATWPADLAAHGGLISLESRLATKEFRPDVFLEGTLEANSVDGQLVALPWTADTALLYYRRDLLERNGHAPPASWEELQRISLKIKADESMRHGYVWQGAPSEDLTCSTLEHIWSRYPEQLEMTGDALRNGTQTRAALAEMSELVESGASPKDTATYHRWTAQTDFMNGEAVFLRDWHNAWENLNSGESRVVGQTGLAPLPAGCLGGQSLGLSAHSLHPEEAVRFMAFLTDYEQQAELATSGGLLPSVEAVYDDQDVLAAVPILRAFRAAFSAAEPRPSMAGYHEISTVVYSEVNRMLAGQQDVDTTAGSIKQAIDLLVR